MMSLMPRHYSDKGGAYSALSISIGPIPRRPFAIQERFVKSLAIWVSLSLLVACRASLAFELPANLSGADVPDYEAILKVEDHNVKPSVQSQPVLHKDGWSKTHRSDPFGPSTTFGNDEVQLDIFGPLNGEPDGMHIERMDRPSKDYNRIQDIRPTDAYDLQAGEKCRFFAFRRGPKHEMGNAEYLGCVTADGIEIAERILASDGDLLSTTSLVKLIRRPVRLDEVLPRDAWFQGRYWLEPLQEATAAEKRENPDFVATLQGGFGQIIVLRRHYPWNYRDTREVDGRRTIRIWNERDSRGLEFSALEGGRFQHLLASKKSTFLQAFVHFGFHGAPRPISGTDTILGEACRWFEMEPRVTDKRHNECITADNIALEVANSRGRFTAISVMRRPVTIEEILSEKAIFDPEAWGIQTTRD